jgi:DNA-binding GntR family transcriptional regulator
MAKHKTDETKGQYATEVEDSVNNARAMIGMDEPAIVIERPRVIAERQPNGEFIERTTPVYVKYSTAFKDELKGITGSELKVWTYIILSINENGTAFPGIRTVAEAVGVSHQTVITAIEGLEKKKLLHVVRGEKRYNIYQPSDEYVGIFSKDPMSQKIRPVKKEEQTSQVSSPDESNGLDLNKTLNKTEQDTTDFEAITKAANKKMDVYLQLAQSPGMKRQARIDSILSYLAGKLRINTETKRWKDFAKFVDDRQQDGQKVDVFISWLLGQKDFDIKFWSPLRMQEMWPQAFAVIVPQSADPNAPRRHLL